MTTSRTRLFCLLGDPVDHSISPQIFTRAFEACGMDAAYLAFRVPGSSLGKAIAGLRALGVAGCNVTVPHKIAVMSHLDSLDRAAMEIGAANVIKMENGMAVGYNTDGDGALMALRRSDLSGKVVALVGYGGAARGVAYAIASSKDPGEVVISGRDRAKAESLAQRLASLFAVKSRSVSIEGLKEAAPDVLVNATPLGMKPWVDKSPVDADVLRAGMVVFDLVYNPTETRLIKEARAIGCTTIGGLDMLVGQAAAAFEIWTGERAPLEEMEKAASEAVAKGGAGE